MGASVQPGPALLERDCPQLLGWGLTAAQGSFSDDECGQYGVEGIVVSGTSNVSGPI